MEPLGCDEAQLHMVDLVAGSLADDDRAALRSHLRACASCAAAHSELEETWRQLGEVAAHGPPADLREATLRSVLTAMERDRAIVTSPWLGVGHVPLAVVSALLVAAATLFLLGGLVWGGSVPEGHRFYCAAIFTGMLVGAFSWIYSATTVNGLHLDAAARIGVLALSITVAATTLCPEIHVLPWWDRSLAGRFFTRTIGAGGSSLVFGFAYGLIPGFLAALFGGRLLAERPVANGLVAAAVVFLLVLPVLYLQSAPFTAGLVASWLCGAAAGTLCGVFGALRVRQRVATVSA
jgi:hypothetical protein